MHPMWPHNAAASMLLPVLPCISSPHFKISQACCNHKTAVHCTAAQASTSGRAPLCGEAPLHPVSRGGSQAGRRAQAGAGPTETDHRSGLHVQVRLHASLVAQADSLCTAGCMLPRQSKERSPCCGRLNVQVWPCASPGQDQTLQGAACCPVSTDRSFLVQLAAGQVWRCAVLGVTAGTDPHLSQGACLQDPPDNIPTTAFG